MAAMRKKRYALTGLCLAWARRRRMRKQQMSAPARAVPAPQPSSAAAPEPRTVWTTPDGQTALVARDWADGAPPTYGVLQRARARHKSEDGSLAHWRAATAQETWHLVDQWYQQHRAQAWPLVAALARLLDERR